MTGLILLVPMLAQAQAVGCCCDPVIKNGSFSTDTACNALGFTFIGPPPNIAVTCDQHCQATLAAAANLCGDGVCQANENQNTCPQDCGQPVIGCGSPAYKPAPAFTTTPVKSEKALRLAYDLACPADYLTVNRCTGDDCTDFTTIAQIPAGREFIDEDPDLEFNQDYTYQLIAHYPVSGDSTPATAIGNIGDLECWNKGANAFCISYSYYNQYRSYLTTYGYAQYSGAEFTSQFGNAVNTTFATQFNNAWQCTDENKLVPTTPAVSCDINQDEYCVADEAGPRCVKQEACNVGFDPFGLFSSAFACETNRYCFYDKSPTTANECYTCDPRMSCYDYKSKGACERDNCGTGSCEWHPTFDALGTGVCVDRDRSNCIFCTQQGTPNLDNTDAASAIWNACREEKSTALSTLENQCFYDKDRRISKGCDEVACADYTRSQCGSPPDGVKLNPDNSISVRSTDTCDIGVCEYHDVTGCIKNADGNTGPGFQDCKFGNQTCEQDHYPPTTTVIPQGAAGRIDTLAIRIFDKINYTTPPQNRASEPGYTTYLCVKTPNNNCDDSRTFQISTRADELLLKNRDLKDEQQILATLPEGNNTLVYYSKDAANNVEVLKETTFYACDACNGPTLLDINLTGGSIYQDTLYTSDTKPTITVTFDEPVQITFAEVSKPGQTLTLSQLTQGMQDTHQFTSTTNLDGTYTLTINAQNNKNIYFEPPGIQYLLTIDPNLAGLTITPADDSIINTSLVPITLNFTRPVTLDNINLLYVDYKNPYAKIEQPIDITKEFETEDNQYFTAKIDKLKGGLYTIAVDAQGYNNLDIFRRSSFHLATKAPGILLSEPSWGVTPFSVFNATIETQFPAECAYVFDTPTSPSAEDYEFYKKFTTRGNQHTTERLTIPFGAARDYPLHTYCTFNGRIIQRSFNISLDPEPPFIQNAFAEPDVIAERYIPEQDIYVTTLRAELNKPGFCKYSLVSSNYNAMTGTFKGFSLLPKTSHTVQINVTEQKPYNYFVTCQGKNELTSTPTTIPLTIDLDLPLSAKSSTPVGFSSTSFTLGAVANKRVICYFGEQPDSITTCMGDCRAGYTHSQPMSVAGTGTYNYYIKCAHPNGEQSDVIDVPIIIDTTPPELNTVDDSTTLPEDAEISWLHNKIRVNVAATDEESGISHYLITLQGQTDKQIVFRDYVSNRTDGEPFYIQTTNNGSPFRLVNNKRYNFKARAVNNVGLVSEEMESDGVRIDISKAPEPCFNGLKDANETDVDCGGSCDACPVGNTCELDSDCATNYCSENICEATSCEDGIMNGVETDVDCGGSFCDACDNSLHCILGSDCLSNYCDIDTNTCIDAPPCADGQLSPGEADVDCGKVCDTKCSQDQNCIEDADCEAGLRCDPETNACTSQPVGDEDNDGIPDGEDDCPGTPPGESIDDLGCGLSQTFTVGDEIHDKWRQDNFGCIGCPDAAADADPDNDDLTNLEEFRAGTNPTNDDTDGDGWNDGPEIQYGTNPQSSAEHPTSIWSTIFKFIIGIILIGGLGYGGYFLYTQYQLKQQAKPTKPAAPKEKLPAHVPTTTPSKQAELTKLRRFAKKEELPEKEWIDLEKKIKKKPLPEKKFEKALAGLKDIASTKISEPLGRVHKILGDMSTKEREKLLNKYQDLLAGKLNKEEKENLFKKLKITSQYYTAHKKDLEKELKHYGKK